MDNQIDSNKTFLSVAQVAGHLNVSKMTIYRLVHTGKLPAVRIGQSYRVSEDAVAKYLEGGTVRAT
ncbi:helix-turn-helix domain-containing protein [Arthrobacter crystallopoietes]|jgi:excisionase family DNA binding protein|uniref:helix-turn-helix domain-containing protein n=1 Tax=Crystallibacter crystallopoietes TaxID=37928 RepID=UPI00111125B3|nr:helix-turn-helix domain-containing protein [Arthrobacter crystallopoietes]QTG79430.1 helix-turn-helix domain-containing protein [Arthrobacter crystallopoietes]